MSKKPAGTTGPAEPKTRKPKAAGMTMLQKFELQAFVKDAPTTTPDATLAKQATDKFGRPVLPATVAEYRKAFGIKPVARPSYAQLERYVELLLEVIAESAPDASVPAMPLATLPAEGGAA